MATVYIETSIVSYLRQRPSSEIVMAAHQLLTHRWWNNERTKYELVVSQYVIDEAAAGDPTLASERLQAYRECEDSASNSSGPGGHEHSNPDDLHSRGTPGR
ncbi:MAG: hypothetical protein WKF77_08060 [Planctomycetaceae bacterium]